jgi:hypothetical protein
LLQPREVKRWARSGHGRHLIGKHSLLPIDCSPFIASLFDGLPIKERLHRHHLSANSEYRRLAVIDCVTRRISMINKSKFALIAVLFAMSATSPALAQAFSKGYGTGNVTPYAFEQSGTPARQNGQTAARSSNAGKIAVHQNGHGRFADTGAQHRVQ